MSSEGCSLDPLLTTGSFVQHLQERLLSLPPELVAVTAAPGTGPTSASDLESDESVYYDVDSPQSSSSLTNSPLATPDTSEKLATPDTPDFPDSSLHFVNHVGVRPPDPPEPEKMTVEENFSQREEGRFRVTAVPSPEHSHLYNGDAPRDTESPPVSDIQQDLTALTISHRVEAVCIPIVVTNGEGKHEIANPPDADDDELILMDRECYERNEETQSEEEEEEQPKKRPELKRCSSLKASRLDEGMSREKKIVRFADALGLDLADIRTFLDEPPKIPKSAFQDLEGVELSSSPLSGSPLSGAAALPERAVVPLFRQPIQQSDFMERLNYCKVCLECASVTDINLFTVTGTVRVVNLAFHKAVWIRYTRDNWKTFVDLPAKYVDNSCDGFSDKFRFVLFAHTLNVGDRLEFAVRFEAGQGVYWDNNRSANYAFQCVPEAPPKPVVSAYLPSSVRLETWGSFY